MAEAVRRVRRPGRRALIRSVLVAVAGLWVVLPSAARAQGGVAQPDAVSFQGEVPAEARVFMDTAAEVLDGAGTKTQIDYITAGTQGARRSFIEGRSDFTISGVPFSEAELADLRKSGRGLIEAPVQAVGLQFFGFVPPLGIFPNKCLDPESDCNPIIDRVPYAGNFRLTSGTIADLFYERSNIWTRPDVGQNLEIDQANQFLFPPIRGARPVVRSDADAYNYYLDAYLAAVEPEVRRVFFAPPTDPTAAAPGPSEVWPNPFTPSRLGMDNAVVPIREGLDPGSSEISQGGTVGSASPSFVTDAFTVNDARPADQRTPMFRAYIRNAAGEWLLATPESITAAVAAGNGTPLAGATSVVPGAYPITWVNKLYAPATGLSADEANGIATLIRWQVGAGQDRAAGLGDGRITAPMVATSLAAADKIVESNCPAAKGTVYSSADGGPFAPPGGLGVKGPVKLCDGPDEAAAAEPDPELTPSAEAFAELDTTDFGDASFDDTAGFSELTPEVASEVAGLDASGDAAGTAGASGTAADPATSRVSATGRMPYPIPGLSLSPLDRMVTLCIGAGMFVVLRSLYQRRGSAA